MNCITVINTNDYWPPNARFSVRDASIRWGCDLVEVRHAPDPFRRKFTLARECKSYDRVLYLDGDILIRDDCPSPFDIVSRECFGAVRNYQDTREKLAERQAMDAKALDWLTPYLGELDMNYGNVVNGGLLLWTNEIHGPRIEALDAKLPQTVPMLAEQIAWGRLFADCLYLLPKTFNRVGRAVWESGHRMTEYVYHWANWFEYRGADAKRERIQRTGWHVPKAVAV